MTITIEIADLPLGLAIVIIATSDKLIVECGNGYTLPEILAALGPALSRAINLTQTPVDA